MTLVPQHSIILFEGHDFSGKSTLAKELSLLLEVPIFKPKKHIAMSNPIIAKLKLFETFGLLDVLEQTNYSLIIDRHYPSEWVYAHVFNRKYNMKMFEHLDKRFAKLNPLIVICFKQFIKNYSDPVVPLEKIEALKYKYFDFAAWTHCNVLLLDTTDENLAREMEEICRLL